MSQVRECVERGFRDIISHFAFLDYKKKLLLKKKYFLNTTSLEHCSLIVELVYMATKQACFFGINPPNLREYIS